MYEYCEQSRFEIGGYIELDNYEYPLMHSDAIALNCGRNALRYIIKAKRIDRIAIPVLICDSIVDSILKEDIEIVFYDVGFDFYPRLDNLDKDIWILLVNYYSQLDNNTINGIRKIHKNIIVDQSHSYFQPRIDGVDTFYTCRKYFGVPDGAFLYSNMMINNSFERDVSFERMTHILGRYEIGASEFYNDFQNNEDAFSSEPIKLMSKLTVNLLHGVNYKSIKNKRIANFTYLHERLGGMNRLSLACGTYMYPLYCDKASEIREKLIKKGIYIPLLWVFTIRSFDKKSTGRLLAENILPLPIDQRYDIEDMNTIVSELIDLI